MITALKLNYQAEFSSTASSSRGFRVAGFRTDGVHHALDAEVDDGSFAQQEEAYPSASRSASCWATRSHGKRRPARRILA